MSNCQDSAAKKITGVPQPIPNYIKNLIKELCLIGIGEDAIAYQVQLQIDLIKVAEKIKRKPLTQEDIKLINKLLMEGKNIDEIAKEVNESNDYSSGGGSASSPPNPLIPG